MLDDELRACFRILEIPPASSLAEVREAYRLLSRVWHPDRFAGNPELIAKATARQQELNVAYQRLVSAYARGYSPSKVETEATPPDHDTTPKQPMATAPVAADERGGRRVRPYSLAAVGGAVVLLGLLLLPFLRQDTLVRTADGARLVANQLAVGSGHGCMAGAQGVYCWGDNDNGQRGGAEASPASRAQPVALAANVLGLAAGLRHTCALLQDGSVQCWGGNFSGQLGNHSLQDRAAPSLLRGDVRFDRISSLAYHSCGVSMSNALYCWGNDTDGQLGVGAPVAECRWDELRFYCSDRPEHVAGGVRWRAVSAGGSHTCAASDTGRVYCWGSNRSQQLGVEVADRCRGPGGVQPCSRKPKQVSGIDGEVVALAAGAAHTCALASDGRVYCWGSSMHGQSGTADSVAGPAPINTSLRFTAIASGGQHTCAITDSGALYCWGSDALGELRGEARSRCHGAPCATQPVRVMRSRVTAVAAGFGRTCVARQDGKVICWGRGEVDSAGSPRPRASVRQASDNFTRALASVRWRAAAVKRFLHRNLVAPLEN